MNRDAVDNRTPSPIISPSAGGVTAEIVHRATTRTLEDYSAKARASATDAILDFLAVAVAGASDPLAGQIAGVYASKCTPRASFLGLPVGGRCTAAAAVNGYVSHALDFDDMGQSILGHPSGPVLSALLPLAEVTHASGRDVLLAYMAAVDEVSLIGRILAGRLQEAGLHTTAILGALGASLACGLLMRLGRRQLEWAASLALVQAAGFVSNFGTPAKPMQVGLASAAGARAAELAGAGVAGSPNGIEAVCALLGVAPDLPDDVTSEWEEGRVRFKRYPSCSLTHQAIEAGRRLQERLGAAVPEKITVHGSYRIPAMLHYPLPADGYQMKFSLPYCLAVALRHPGRLLPILASGSLDHEALDLAGRVEFRVHPRLSDASAIKDEFTQVEVRTSGGEVLCETVKGRVAITGRSELLGKAAWCFESRGWGSSVDRLVTLVGAMEGLCNVSDLVAVVSPGETHPGSSADPKVWPNDPHPADRDGRRS